MWICPNCKQAVVDANDKCPKCQTARPFEPKIEKTYGFDASKNHLFEASCIILAVASILYGIAYFTNNQVAGGILYLLFGLFAIITFILRIAKVKFAEPILMIGTAVFEVIICVNALVYFPDTFDCVTNFILSLGVAGGAIIGTILFLKGNHKFDKLLYSICGLCLLAIHAICLINMFVTFMNTLQETYYTWFLVLCMGSQLIFMTFAIVYFVHLWTGFGTYANIRQKKD